VVHADGRVSAGDAIRTPTPVPTVPIGIAPGEERAKGALQRKKALTPYTRRAFILKAV
jgi:hypothetical protein